jgi:hypothetical protein
MDTEPKYNTSTSFPPEHSKQFPEPCLKKYTQREENNSPGLFTSRNKTTLLLIKYMPLTVDISEYNGH